MNHNSIISFIAQLEIARRCQHRCLKYRNVSVVAPILKMLFKEHLIESYFLKDNNYYIYLNLLSRYKYLYNKFKIISKPSKQIYATSYKLKSLYQKNTKERYYISTIKGILNIKDAVLQNLGGIILFVIELR